jgi:uncharacterized alkaline shock family protein YloU
MANDDPASGPPRLAIGGRVEISPQAVATVARSALLSCYGVVGLHPGRRTQGLLGRLGHVDPLQGIAVQIRPEGVTLDLHIIVQYGVRISEVARNVMQSVAFSVERALGMPVTAVNVHVDGLHVAKDA